MFALGGADFGVGGTGTLSSLFVHPDHDDDHDDRDDRDEGDDDAGDFIKGLGVKNTMIIHLLLLSCGAGDHLERKGGFSTISSCSSNSTVTI